MKFSKSVTFDMKTIDLIDDYMNEYKISNFSYAVRAIILEHSRFKKIAMQLQKKDQ